MRASGDIGNGSREKRRGLATPGTNGTMHLMAVSHPKILSQPGAHPGRSRTQATFAGV